MSRRKLFVMILVPVVIALLVTASTLCGAHIPILYGEQNAYKNECWASQPGYRYP